MRWGLLLAVGAASRALVGPRPCRDALACAARLARAFPDTRNRTALAVRGGVVRAVDALRSCVRERGFALPADGEHTGLVEGASDRTGLSLLGLFADAALYRGNGSATICEVGFNYGLSASFFLAAYPRARVYSFDLADKPYSSTAEACVHAAFPGRFALIAGDSTQTVPAAPRLGCDVAFVDGYHFHNVPFADIVNLQALSRRGALTLVDCCDMPAVYGGFLAAQRHGVVGPIVQVMTPAKGKERSVCVGSYL